MLKSYYKDKQIEAGCDEAGRGCLAGPVFAAAVILPRDFSHPLINDSKKLNEKTRYKLREDIMNMALAYAVASVDQEMIDRINILQASILAMHKALDLLEIPPEFIIVDGNKFKAYKKIPYKCIIKGDGIYSSIAAASILAKTCRDDYMNEIHEEFPQYKWDENKGYPTLFHREAVKAHGITFHHRKTFIHLEEQLRLEI
jgi:ribonuclease HII